MRPTTQRVWPGWLGSLLADGTKYRLTWDEWRARQREQLRSRSACGSAPTPGPSEIAARAFLAWYDAAAGFRGDPQFDDRELAVRRYMHTFQEFRSGRILPPIDHSGRAVERDDTEIST